MTRKTEQLVKTDGKWDMSPRELAFHRAKIAEYKEKLANGDISNAPP